jgi:hypothetical protein
VKRGHHINHTTHNLVNQPVFRMQFVELAGELMQLEGLLIEVEIGDTVSYHRIHELRHL